MRRAGRITQTRSPISGSNADSTLIRYDIQDRDTLTVKYGPAMNGVAADSAHTRAEYDKEGNLTRVDRRRGGNSPGNDPLVAKYTYDGAGRRTRDSVGGRVDSLVYDPAGNLVARIAPLGTVSYVYDAANRLRRRIVPQQSYGQLSGAPYRVTFPTTGAGSVCIAADTAYFTYDGAGRILTANNIHSRITRQYAPAGYQTREVQNVRTFGSSANECETDSSPLPGGEWTWQSHQFDYTYDRDGRRTTTPNAAYGYATDGRGVLALAASNGDTTRFFYDAALRRDSVDNPGAMGEKLQYDGTTGRLAVREVRNAGTRKMLDSLDYDYQGRITGARYHYALGADTAGPVRITYTGLGALDSISNHLNNVDSLPEWFKTDAHGNRVRTKRPGHTAGGDTDQLRDFTYDAHGRLTGIEYTGGGGFSSVDVLLYDAAGNNTLHSHLATGDSTQLVMYYGIDDQLVIVNRWVKTGPGGVYEEHRYDALGRRVLSRAEFASICDPGTYGSGRCAHRLDLTFWDGSQVLGETRFIGSGVGLPIQSGVPGIAAGAISYVHAGGIDEPIMIWADTSNIIPFANWKGDYLFGTINGVPEGTGDWPGGKTRADGDVTLGSTDGFIGRLVPGLLDASGLKYRRNRYLNPAVGQFTQGDPIGLVGGQSVYGYALGDPINGQDPFGLCTCTYSQSSGEFTCDLDDSGTWDIGTSYAYSGSNGWNNGRSSIGLNDPDAEGKVDAGPLPAGTYTIGNSGTWTSGSGNVHPNTMTLTPDRATRDRITDYGRDPNDFLIHGGWKPTGGGSAGCIVMEDNARRTFAEQTRGKNCKLTVQR